MSLQKHYYVNNNIFRGDSMKYNYNLIAVFDESAEKLLFCRRRKEPFKGLYNFVGGKIESGEDGLAAAYRELWEETGITSDDIGLHSVMVLDYPLDSIHMEAYAGRLNKPIEVHGDENELHWLPVTENFFDHTRFAGNGNVGHIIWEILQDRTINIAGR